MKTIQPADQPQPKGHYSPGIEHNGLIFVSGQLPMSLDTREPFTGDIGEQTELALRNVEAGLKAAGSDLQRGLQFTIYVVDMDLCGAGDGCDVGVLGGVRRGQ